jgi:hypothetical protein
MLAIVAIAFVGILVLLEIKTMTALNDAVTALVAEVAESKGKLESIKTFVEGVPALVGTAVADALAAAAAGEADAVKLVEAATASISDEVDAVFTAIDANDVKS